MKCDVAIIGGGPAGSTVGTLLKKYKPDLDVLIVEKELFPRDHVGESLLPMVPRVLNEMGVWDKVEAENFPIKLGGVYRWGKMSDQDLFYFRFLGKEPFSDGQRPGKYEGQRTATTFHVDRSIYDKILLDHAAESGCCVHQQTRVESVVRSGDRVDGLLAVSDKGDGRGPIEERIEARYYVDASGSESRLRKAMDVGVHSPTTLRNIAVWDYWQNAEWAEKIGSDGTFVYVLSIGYGWLWFIPLGPTRTSIGFITSAEHFKKSNQTTEQLYQEAISKEPLVRELTKDAAREGRLQATKDWSFVADRLYGQNWFLAGDAAGFADPILAAGMTLAQSGARMVAYTILEQERGQLEPDWLAGQYERVQKRNTMNHIRFADYWYSANEQFTDLQEYCSEIAKNAGITLDADAAFQWLGTGGFTDELSGVPLLGTYSLTDVKSFTSRFSNTRTAWKVLNNNVFEMNLEGAVRDQVALYSRGRVEKLECWRRGESIWPLHLVYKGVFESLQRENEIQPLAERFIYELRKANIEASHKSALLCLETLEALVTEGWVTCRRDPAVPMLELAGS